MPTNKHKAIMQYTIPSKGMANIKHLEAVTISCVISRSYMLCALVPVMVMVYIYVASIYWVSLVSRCVRDLVVGLGVAST